MDLWLFSQFHSLQQTSHFHWSGFVDTPPLRFKGKTCEHAESTMLTILNICTFWRYLACLAIRLYIDIHRTYPSAPPTYIFHYALMHCLWISWKTRCIPWIQLDSWIQIQADCLRRRSTTFASPVAALLASTSITSPRPCAVRGPWCLVVYGNAGIDSDVQGEFQNTNG